MDIGGEVTGRTRLACWKEFEQIRENLAHRGFYTQVPADKKDAYARMEQLPGTGEWVLWYRFHT